MEESTDQIFVQDQCRINCVMFELAVSVNELAGCEQLNDEDIDHLKFISKKLQGIILKYNNRCAQ